MPVCVQFLPSGFPIGSSSSGITTSFSQLLAPDPGCASGLVLSTEAELAGQGQIIKLDTSSDPQRVQDMTDLFYAFLLVLVVVWGVKQLLNLFTGDTEKG